METKFIRIDYSNNPAKSARLEAHHEAIEEQAKDGFEYKGYIPTKLGPSGKTLEIDLIFQK